MAISSIGVGSNLPLDKLLEDLRSSENNALLAIQSKQITAENRLSAYSKLSSAIDALKTAGAAISGTGTFGALKTSVTGDGLTASASSKAIAGQYSIKVEALATTQTLVTAGQASRTDANGTDGVMTITLGDGSQATLDLTGKSTSLEGLVSAINADPKLGVQATIVNDGTGTPHRLLLTSTKTGTDASVASIAVTGNNALQGIIGYDRSAPLGTFPISETAATNAAISINGIPISSQNNTITDAIDGVTLSLTKADLNATNTIVISRDDSAASKAVGNFVSAYNNLQSTIKSLTTYDVDKKQGSALTGDSLARRVQTQFQSVLNVNSSSGAVRSLVSIGINSDPKTGALTIDNDKLTAALKDHLPDVQNLLTGENGLTNKISTIADAFLASGGLISAAKEGTDRSIVDLKKQYDATSARIDSKMETYRMQFTALDTMVAQMNSVSTYLTQQLSMLGSSNK